MTSMTFKKAAVAVAMAGAGFAAQAAEANPNANIKDLCRDFTGQGGTAATVVVTTLPNGGTKSSGTACIKAAVWGDEPVVFALTEALCPPNQAAVLNFDKAFGGVQRECQMMPKDMRDGANIPGDQSSSVTYLALSPIGSCSLSLRRNTTMVVTPDRVEAWPTPEARNVLNNQIDQGQGFQAAVRKDGKSVMIGRTPKLATCEHQ